MDGRRRSGFALVFGCMACSAQVACGDDLRPPIVLTVYRGGAVDRVAVHARMDEAPWVVLEPERTNEFDLEFSISATTTYSFAMVCEPVQKAPSVFVTSATPNEGPTPTGYCNWSGGPRPSSVLQGVMVTPGSVAAGFERLDASLTNWTFQLSVDPGVVDLVALTDKQVFVRRNVRVERVTDIGIIDVARDGVPLEEAEVKFVEPQPSRVTTLAILETPNGTRVPLSARGNRTITVPRPGELPSSDNLEVQVRTSDGERRERGFLRSYGTAAFELLPAIDPIALSFDAADGADLGLLPPVEHAWFTTSFDHVDHARDLTFSPGWIAATRSDRLHIELPSEVNSALRVQRELTRSVSAIRWLESGQYEFTSIRR